MGQSVGTKTPAFVWFLRKRRIKASNAGFGFNCDTLSQIKTLPGVSPGAILETIGREKRKQAEFGDEKAELGLMTSAYAPGNRADRRPSCRSGA